MHTIDFCAGLPAAGEPAALTPSGIRKDAVRMPPDGTPDVDHQA
ncbi:hypothetical protein GCM10009678_74770 [Actinomadura kijaniata]|uniref:Uncharacterized protein n=1 Tax=Actinomadura namibiensis TaxID=182080 RepID=A0A7W3LZU9_ACTNM|nr:hypothetical protein [Actinomadura namibiensis]MBA8957394.1 hypothetical protein [Actinomadura namibiensis]